MRWTPRRALTTRKSVSLAALLGTAIVSAGVLAVPADGGAAGAAGAGAVLGAAGVRGAAGAAGARAVVRRLDPVSHATTTSNTGQAFGGLAAVGALFGYSSGKLGTHFCTASVVHSRGGDLAVTAAHCVTGDAGQIAFVPGYANGKEPFGVWQVVQVFTDQAWQASQDPDDDVAFLRLSPASDGVPVEDITGAEELGAGTLSAQSAQAGALVQVIGYPDGQDEPVWCVNQAKSFSVTQLEFDCGGYTDGTSGGPFLTDVSSVSGQGTVIGVIGGYEQGGLTPAVSYSAVFGASVVSLYLTAQAAG